jgi:molybdopterin/thiamine biosynthesis adenylyltransferase
MISDVSAGMAISSVKPLTIALVAIDRYHRQTLLPQIGSAGQAKLAASSVLLVGCGALGSTIAEQLARAGIGKIRIADRDIVELTNLQRQVLFGESDARDALPKAVAAAARLAKINSGIAVEPLVVDVDADNIESLVQGVQVILDGTDNVGTRYLINDVSVKHGLPWIYGACVGTEGRVMTIQRTSGPCLRCVFPQAPDPTELATCDTAGVLGPIASVVGSLQAIAAIKILSGNGDAIANELLTLDLWNNRMRSVSLVAAKRADCPTCGLRRFEFLDSPDRQQTAKLCGRNAVQVRAVSNGTKLTLEQLAQRLRSAGTVQVSPFMVRCTLDADELIVTAFGDGRVIVQGTADPARARSLVARYLGS